MQPVRKFSRDLYLRPSNFQSWEHRNTHYGHQWHYQSISLSTHVRNSDCTEEQLFKTRNNKTPKNWICSLACQHLIRKLTSSTDFVTAYYQAKNLLVPHKYAETRSCENYSLSNSKRLKWSVCWRCPFTHIVLIRVQGMIIILGPPNVVDNH